MELGSNVDRAGNADCNATEGGSGKVDEEERHACVGNTGNTYSYFGEGSEKALGMVLLGRGRMGDGEAIYSGVAIVFGNVWRNYVNETEPKDGGQWS